MRVTLRLLTIFFLYVFSLTAMAVAPSSPVPQAVQPSALVSSVLPTSSAGVPNMIRQVPSPQASTLPTPAVPHSQMLIPNPPDFDAKAYILVDANSGYVLAEKNADVHLPPASLTKLMALYIAANSLRTGQIHPTDQVPISENAWRMGGSRMFIKVGSTVPIDTLISGIVTASGNDATVALAEYLAGTEANFVNIMNQTAANLGMKDTNYMDSNGLPTPNHYSTARDLALLSRAWVANFPEYYPWFKEKWFVYNKIRQPNRNRLLWRDPSVDGIKTGHTDDAGYCLIASAVRNGMRLIAVVLGTPNDAARTNDSEALLNYGFRFYETHKLFAANTAVSNQRLWLGQKNSVELGVLSDMFVTIPIGQYKSLKANATVNGHLRAPIVKGKAYGTINVTLNDKVVASQPLVALQDIGRTNFLFAAYDYFLMLFHH